MKKTNVFTSKEDFDKLCVLALKGWLPGDRIMVFSVGEGIRKDQSTVDARKVCHQLALDYGLPEIEGFYGITRDREFVYF